LEKAQWMRALRELMEKVRKDKEQEKLTN